MEITRTVKVWGGVLLLCGSSYLPSAYAGRVADIANTKHNFSASPGFSTTLPTGQQREMRAQSEVQICVFCHTPHAATNYRKANTRFMAPTFKVHPRVRLTRK